MSKKILVVDDEQDVRKFLTVLLKKHGYETVTAEDGLMAMDLIREHRPDLVTLDLAMPHKTGTEFYRKISRDKELEHIPIIVVSGLPGRHLAVKKPFAVFDKPIDPEKFIATVVEAIGPSGEED